jgi:hypothetical protein
MNEAALQGCMQRLTALDCEERIDAVENVEGCATTSLCVGS